MSLFTIYVFQLYFLYSDLKTHLIMHLILCFTKFKGLVFILFILCFVFINIFSCSVSLSFYKSLCCFIYNFCLWVLLVLWFCELYMFGGVKNKRYTIYNFFLIWTFSPSEIFMWKVWMHKKGVPISKITSKNHIKGRCVIHIKDLCTFTLIPTISLFLSPWQFKTHTRY